MNKPKSDQPRVEPIVLSVNCIADGKFFAAGSGTPFNERTLPEHLKVYLATGDEEQIQAGLQLQHWAEEAASEPLPEDVAEVLQDSHDKYIGLARQNWRSTNPRPTTFMSRSPGRQSRRSFM